MRIVRFTVDVSAIRQLRHRPLPQPGQLTPAPRQPPAGAAIPDGGGPTVRAITPREAQGRR